MIYIYICVKTTRPAVKSSLECNGFQCHQDNHFYPCSLIPSVNPFPRVVPGATENLGMSTLGFHSREGQGMLARFESQLALEFWHRHVSYTREGHLMFEGVMALHQLSTISPQLPTLQEEIRSLLKDLAAQTSACAKAQVQSIEWFGKLAAEMLFGFIYFNETHLNWTRTASNQCCVD